MITVHYLNNSRSQRILWLLEELEVPYEIKKYERLPDLLSPPELLKVFPLGKTPIITDTGADGKQNITLAESGAIVEYILKNYSNGKFSAPQSGQQYIDNLYFTHYAEGSIMPVIVFKIMFGLIPERFSSVVGDLSSVFAQISDLVTGPDLKKHSDLVESHLSKKSFFAGGSEPTSADFLMIMPAELLVSYNLAGPATKEYVKRIQERPTYQAAVRKGGEYRWLIVSS